MRREGFVVSGTSPAVPCVRALHTRCLQPTRAAGSHFGLKGINLFFLQKESWKNQPPNSPTRPGTAMRKPRCLEAGTWHVVFGLISKETRCVHPPPSSPPLPIPPSVIASPRPQKEPFPPSHLPQAAPGRSAPTRHQSLPQRRSHTSPTSSPRAPGPSPSDFLPKSLRHPTNGPSWTLHIGAARLGGTSGQPCPPAGSTPRGFRRFAPAGC